MSKPVLAIDFDDTLVYNAQRVVDAYNRDHDGAVSLNDVYVVEKFGNPANGWHHSRAEALVWIRDYLISEEGRANPPAPGTLEVLRRLKEHFDPIIVTGRTPDWSAGTEAWLAKYLPGIFGHIYYAGEIPKAELCRQAGAHTIVDDSPYYLGFCVEAGMQVILFGDYPWNRDELLAHDMPRAKNWTEVERMLLP